MLCLPPVELPAPKSPASALVSIVNEPYGLTLVDLGITEKDLENLDQIVISKNQHFNKFGDFSTLASDIAQFLNELGDNDLNITEKIGKKLSDITFKILEVSERKTAWVCLRASTPTQDKDLLNWHMDGYYYPTKNVLKYKFAATLIGASTLFYPVPTEFTELRRVIWQNMNNRKFMMQLCCDNYILEIDRGQGVLFIASDSKKAALHSEPPVHEPRLFFSIVPCEDYEIDILKTNVMQMYK